MASNRLYVGNLSYTTTEDDLRSAFAKGGREVKDVFVVTDRETGRPRGFAFVEMGSAEEAQQAASEMDGATVGDRELKVNEAAERVERDKPQRESSGRGYDRGGSSRPVTRGYGADKDKSERPERKPREAPRRGARDGDRKPRDF